MISLPTPPATRIFPRNKRKSVTLSRTATLFSKRQMIYNHHKPDICILFPYNYG